MKKEKDDNENKGRRSGKGPKPMKGAKKAKRESAKQERKNLLTKNPVVNRSNDSGFDYSKSTKKHKARYKDDDASKIKIMVDKKKPTPALKSPTMKAVKSKEPSRDEMHATDFGKRSIDKNPSLGVITSELKKGNISMNQQSKSPLPLSQKKK